MKRIARRYAKALFELAVESREIDSIEKDFEAISGILEQQDEFKAFLENPLINEHRKYQVVQELFKDKLDAITFNFVLMVTEKKRIELLPAIIEEFRHFILKHRNMVEGELVSAVSLDSEQADKIKTNIETLIGKSVLLKEDVDEEIIGGFVVKVEDLVIDNSIRYQLNKLREKLIAE